MKRTLLISGIVAVVTLPIGAVAVGHTPAVHASNASPTAQQLSRDVIAESQGWRRYDEAPGTAVVRPVRVIRVAGNVTNASALARPAGSKRTTLTYTAGGAAPSLVLDYGRDVAGIPTFDVAAASGTTLSVAYTEPLYNLGTDGAASVGLFESGNSARTDTFTLSGAGIVTASLIQGGERYERLTLTTPGTVTLRSATIRFTAPRETPALLRGHFLSNDRLLNRIWFAGVYTLNLNQLAPGTSVTAGVVNHRHYILDGAKRDRAVWSGDHVISDLTDYYVSDPAYARDSLSLFLTHPATTASKLGLATGTLSQTGPLPGVCSPNLVYGKCFTWSASYSVLVIPALYNYYLYTGNLGFVRAHWPAVVRQMAWDAQQVGADGLFAVNATDDADWNIQDIPGKLTYVNAAYVLALQSAAKLAAALGHASQAKAWSSAAAAVKQAVNGVLWNPSTGVYDASTTTRGSVVQDANVTAILAGIPSPARAHAIAHKLQSALRGRFGPVTVSSPAPAGFTRWTSPYMGSFHVLADFAAGDETAALVNVRREWGYVIGQDPGGVEWERIQLDGKLAPGALADSAAHAWSTGPTPALSQYVLGVRPATPGFAKWIVAPEPASLRWVQGVVPTPHGSLSARWQRGRHDSLFKLTVIAPPHTSGVVTVPLLGSARVIAMDGRIVWNGHHAVGGLHAYSEGGAVSFTGIRGTHTFAWA